MGEGKQDMASKGTPVKQAGSDKWVFIGGGMSSSSTQCLSLSGQSSPLSVPTPIQRELNQGL